jgi:hypothetical protein
MELAEEFQDFWFDCVPEFAVEAWPKTIWPRASGDVHVKEGRSDLIRGEGVIEVAEVVVNGLVYVVEMEMPGCIRGGAE